MIPTKTHNYECCMCGDHGLSYELFRCKVCHFRSQHRYCSNLYPKAESYRVCNWCLIQKDDDDDRHHHTLTTTPTSNNNSTNTTNNSPSSTHDHHQKPKKFNNHLVGPKIGSGSGPKSLHPTSPIKKQAARSPEEAKSPSGRKRISGPAQDQEKLRRTKSEEISKNKNNNNNNNNNNNSSNSNNSSRSSGGNGNGNGNGNGGGPAVIKHVFRNKVRRYKLLDEVSS